MPCAWPTTISRPTDYLRSEIDRLRFGTALANDLADFANFPTVRSHQQRIAESFLQPSYTVRDPRDRPYRGYRFSPGTFDSYFCGVDGT